MQDDHRPPCTYVSEGDEERELLENSEALDPCGEYEDVEFSNRVKNFLEKYEKEISKETCTPQVQEIAPSSSKSQAKIVRFKDAPEEVESSSESPIIGKQPPRRSLLMPPAAPATPGARSTPFTRSEDWNKWNHFTNPSNVPYPILASSLTSRYRMWTTHLPLSDQKPISICTDEPNVIHQWTEPLTFRHDNYAHFISKDCEPTNPIAKLLVDTELLDLQDLWGCRPKKGQVLVTPHGRHKTYSVVIKRRHVDNIDWKDVGQGLRNLRTALEKDSQTICRMENSWRFAMGFHGIVTAK